jgi:murein DD-endopeptidase MepM/ murein hydrolase activator NlpD
MMVAATRALKLPSFALPPLALADRTRHAALTATLIAGVTVAGVSAATPASQAYPLLTHQASHSVETSQVPTSQGLASTGASANAAEFTQSQALATDVDAPPRGGAKSWAAPAHKQKLTTATAATTDPTASDTTPTDTTATGTSAAWVNPLPEAEVTSCFGERWGHLHAGVDLAAAYGTPIRAVGAGTVIAAGPAAGYGNAVLIDHHNGYLTHYGHMSEITVTVGQQVTPGQQIGKEGSTGHSTGPHLHFEVHKGTYKNPIEPTEWLHQHNVDIQGCTPLTPNTPKKPQD